MSLDLNDKQKNFHKYEYFEEIIGYSMLSSNELLAIGASLVQAVREHIKYSENITVLYNDFKKTNLYKSRKIKFDETIINTNEIHNNHTPNILGKLSLECGVAYCPGLSLASIYMAQGISAIQLYEPYYLSLVSTGFLHEFVLMHQSSKLFYNRTKKWTQYSTDFYKLMKDPELSNAIIVDPWIYKATKLSHFHEHFRHAELYKVEHNYSGSLYTKNIHIRISSASYVITIQDEYIKTFMLAFAEQKKKLQTHSQSFAIGYSAYEIRQNIKEYIELREQSELKSFVDFFVSLVLKSFKWYDKSNIKIDALNDMINSLKSCISQYKYASHYQLHQLYWRALVVCSLIIGKAPNSHLSTDNIHHTTAIKQLFSVSVTPNHRLEFEEINDLDLDWIRDTRDMYYHHKDRNLIFLSKLQAYIPGFTLDSLYNNHKNYINLLADILP